MGNKLETISNLFEGKEIRSIWDAEKEEYYFSVVDIISALTDSKMPGNVEGGPIYQAFDGFEEIKFERGDEWAPHGRLIGRDSK